MDDERLEVIVGPAAAAAAEGLLIAEGVIAGKNSASTPSAYELEDALRADGQVLFVGDPRAAGLSGLVRDEVVLSLGDDRIFGERSAPEPGGGARRAEARIAEKIASNAARAVGEEVLSRQARRALERERAKLARSGRRR